MEAMSMSRRRHIKLNGPRSARLRGSSAIFLVG